MKNKKPDVTRERREGRILIVDDEKDLVLTLVDILESRGYQVEVAHSVQSGREKVEAFDAQVALLDIRLGRDSGIDLISELEEVRPGILCVMITAYAVVDSAIEAIHRGAYDYLQKPLDMQYLLATLDRCFGKLRLESEKAAAEEALRESEERLRGILSSLHEAFIVVYDREGNYISAWGPPEIEKRYGISGAETVGRPLKDILPPQEAKERIAHIQHILETGESWRGEQLVHLPGGDFWHDISLSPLGGPAGEVSAVVGFIRDITERKRAEEAIQESEERLKEVVENMPVLFDAFDENGIALFWNKECERVTGYSSDEIVGNPKSLELVCPDPEYRAWVLEQLRELGSYYRDWELDVQCKNGETRTIAWSNISRDHPIPGWWSWGIGVDVTERKRAEEEIGRLAKFPGENPNPVLRVAKDGTIIYANAASLPLLGVWGRQMGQPLPDDWRKFTLDVLRSGSSQDTEVGCQDRILSLTFAPVIDADYVNVYGLDITERVRAEEAIQQRNRELAELNAIIGTITSTLTLEQVLQRILAATLQFLPHAGDATVQLLDEADVLRTWVASGSTTAGDRRMVFHPGEGIVGWAFQERQPVNVPDVTVEPRFRPSARPLAYRSLLVVPLLSREQALGTLSLTAAQVGAFSEQDERLLQGLAGYAAIAVQNAQLYEQTRRDAETKAVLLDEVNHRVKNNLAAIIGLLYAERRHAAAAQQDAYRDVTEDMINRIQGLATVHSLLSASAWTPLPLSELVAQVSRAPLRLLPPGKRVLVEVSPSAVQVTPRQANGLALVFNELVTNVIKHALPGRDEAHITVNIAYENGEDTVLCEFRDDGPGYPEEVLRLERHNVGLYLLQTIVRDNLDGEVALRNDHGAVIVIKFESEE